MTGFNYSRLNDENKAVVDHLPLEYLEHLYSLKCRQRKKFLNLCRTGFSAGHSQEGQSRMLSDALRATPAPPLYTRAEKVVVLEPYESSLKAALEQMVDLGCVSYIFYGNLPSTSVNPTQFGRRKKRSSPITSLELIQRLTQMWSNGPQEINRQQERSQRMSTRIHKLVAVDPPPSCQHSP